MSRFPVALFAATVIAITITHFVHLSDIMLDHGSLGRIPGQSFTRAAVCVPIFLTACFVAVSARFARSGRRWGIGALAIAVACWVELIVSH